MWKRLKGLLLGREEKEITLLMPITMCQQLYMFSSFNPSKKLVRSYILLSHFKDKYNEAQRD